MEGRRGMEGVTLLRSSERNNTFFTGVETPACILSSLRDYCLSCFTRHFGLRLGRTNKFVLLSACSKIGRRRGDAPTEFCMEDAFYTGTPPFGLHPCLYSVVPTGLLFVLFHKTFWTDGWWDAGLWVGEEEKKSPRVVPGRLSRKRCDVIRSVVM